MIVRAGALVAALALGTGAASAQPAEVPLPSPVPVPPRGAGDAPATAVAEAATSDQTAANVNGSIASSLGAYGDPFGVRGALRRAGIDYSLTYIGEVLGNPVGGARQGAIYDGRLDVQLDVDLGKLAGWSGAAFHANAYQIHGTGLSRYYVNNLDVVSGIEALPSTRLYEAWVEQTFLGGKLALRAGQLGADTEFFVSQTATVFLNSTFGWPDFTAVNLPSGGSSYPLATPAVRVKLAPTDRLSVLVGLFDGDPAAPTSLADAAVDPQRRNRTGTSFRTDDPPVLMVEGAYAYNITPDAIAEPGTVKLGYFHHFGRFADLRADATGRSLADPSSTGIARRFRGDDGVYGILDQTIYREAADRMQGASVFLRLAGAPADRNLVDLYADAGIAYQGLFAGRPDDTIGLSLAHSRISQRAIDLDRDTIALTGIARPKRSGETTWEATYQAVVVPGFTVQPDVQYIVHPGGGIANPRDPNGARIRNAAVLGARATIRY